MGKGNKLSAVRRSLKIVRVGGGQGRIMRVIAHRLAVTTAAGIQMLFVCLCYKIPATVNCYTHFTVEWKCKETRRVCFVNLLIMTGFYD